MGDLIMASTVAFCFGVAAGVLLCIHRDRAEAAHQKQRAADWEDRYYRVCDQWADDVRLRFAAEKAAAVETAQAIVTGKVA